VVFMDHKIIFVGLFFLILVSFGFAYVNNSQTQLTNVIEFENSNWNYIKGYGFVDDKAIEFLKEQEFTERSRNYFLGEIS